MSCPGYGWGTGIRTPIDGSKVRSPAIGRSPNNGPHRSRWAFECRDPDLNWGHQHFQCCALPTELSRQRGQPCWPTPRERAMRFELTTFSLARRCSTTELRPHIFFAHPPQSGSSWEVDPVGFEPTISSVQGRRLPTRPRAHADERTRTSTPLRATDPKSAASANSATSARESAERNRSYPRFCMGQKPIAVICLTPVKGWRLMVCGV